MRGELARCPSFDSVQRARRRLAAVPSCAIRTVSFPTSSEDEHRLTPAVGRRTVVLHGRLSASDRDRHLPLHRHRGLDATDRGARQEGYVEALAEHRRSSACTAFAVHGGRGRHARRRVPRTFSPTRRGALEAAREGQRALASGPVQVRMGLHTGKPQLTGEGYVGRERAPGCAHRGVRPWAARSSSRPRRERSSTATPCSPSSASTG